MWRILKSVFFFRRILPHTKVLPDGNFGQINWKKPLGCGAYYFTKRNLNNLQVVWYAQYAGVWGA